MRGARWEDAPGELEALAERAGCRLVRRMGNGAMLSATVECPDRWASVALLEEFAQRDAMDPELRALARALVRRSPPAAWPAVLLEYVQDAVPFVPERVETFTGWRHTFEHGGDCDDSARLLVAMLRALGLRARLAVLGDPPMHVAAQVLGPRGVWLWMEATIRGELGEHPVAACVRLGLPVRADLGA